MSQSIAVTKKEFGVHPAIIYSIIAKQASGLPKAMLELAMNSVDANATKIDITIDQNGFTFADNGKGFKDAEEVESYFGTFGTPHQQSDAVYGRFRVGRGQIMMFCKSDWYSRDFCMHVDLNIDINDVARQDEIGYFMSFDHEFYQGCKIVGQFYKPQDIGDIGEVLANDITPYDTERFIPSFVKLVKYLPIPVFINGQRVNASIENVLRHYEDETAIYAIEQAVSTQKANIVNVYNNGVFAYQLDSAFYEGDIISLSNIELNMARNQAKATCKVASAIKRKLSALNQKAQMEGRRPKRKGRKIENLGNFIDQIWRSVFGLNDIFYTDLSTMINQKSITTIDDQRYSIVELFKKLGIDNRASNDIVLYDLDDASNRIVPSSQDGMKVDRGFLPLDIFPSKELMEEIHCQVKLNMDIFLCNKVNDHYLSSLVSQNPHRFTFDFSLMDSMERYKVLFQILELLTELIGKINENQEGLYTQWKINRWINYNEHQDTRFIMLDDVVAEKVNASAYAEPSKLNLYERMIVRSLNSAMRYRICLSTQYHDLLKDKDSRKIEVCVVNDDNVVAYTDGEKSIIINEKHFKAINKGEDFEYLITVILHELSHTNSSQSTAVHGAEFCALNVDIYASNIIDSMNAFYENMFYEITKDFEKTYDQIPPSMIEKIMKHQQRKLALNHA